MEKISFNDWNSLVYLVSDVYGATKRLKAGNSGILCDKIRKTAVSITVRANETSPQSNNVDLSKIYPIISSISVLETYLQLAKRQKILRNIKSLEEKLREVKDLLHRKLGES